MVKLKGGLHNLGLGGFLRQLVLWHDRTSTFYIGTPTKFVHTAYCQKTILIGSLTRGFRDALVLRQFSTNMVNLLDDVCAYVTSVNDLPYPWRDSEQSDLVSSATELEVRLLVLRSGYDSQFPSHGFSKMEECLCMSLMVFLRLMPHECSFPPLGCNHLSARLRLLLCEIMALPSWYRYSDLVLWMAFMGAIVARAAVVKEQELSEYFAGLHKQADMPLLSEEVIRDESSFWIFKLLEISSVLGDISKEEVKSHLLRFLWVDMLCEPYSQEIWSSLELAFEGFRNGISFGTDLVLR